jgi:uncharacterized repeat protein (TIGR01451 family)
MKKYLLILFTLIVCAENTLHAQYILRAPTQRFSRPSQRGNILYVANSIINTGGPGQGTAPPEAAGAGNNNNGFTTNYIDIDADATTFSSSSADLGLASCTQVLFAGLYWGAGRGGVNGASPGNSTNDTAWITAAANTVKFKLPGGAYTNITATVFDKFNQARVRNGVPGAQVSHSGYMCFADVTTMVTGLANPNGTYTLANMVGPVATGKAAGYGGWTMVIVYSDPSLQVRNLTVFDGCVVVSPSAGNVDVNVSGFITPPTGPVSCQLGAVVIDGDRNDGNDAYQFSQTGIAPFLDLTPTTVAPGNATSRLNDSWNSTISYNGAVVTTRNPAFNNTYGYDADIFELPNAGNVNLGNNRTSATVRFTTTVETYHLQVLTTSISNFNPTYTFQKSATDINGGAFLPGDSILYRIRYSNRGNDSSTNTIIVDNLPSGTAFVPGSIKIGTATRTDGAGDDQAEYDFSNNRIMFRLGVGANSVTGGRVGPGVIDSVEFKVVSPSSCQIVSCVGSLRNSARINYGGKLSGGVFFDSSGVNTAGCLVQGPVIMPMSGPCFIPKDTLLVNRCNSFSVLLPYARYAGYTFYSAQPFIPANIYNQYVPVTTSGVYWAYFTNGAGCSDTARIVVIITSCPDIDDDNDGIPDYVEFDNTLALAGGATPNWNNPAYPGYVDYNLDLVNDNFDYGADVDNDGIPNFYDTGFSGFVDSNGDGVNDNADKDLDGIPNQYDLDSDNDGIPDVVESFGVDTNGDGVIDNYIDGDNDGFSTNVDGSPAGGVNGSGNGLTALNLDNDNIPNYLDLDSDNDGIPDVVEVAGSDVTNSGLLDAFVDANFDGINDSYIGAAGLLRTGPDVIAPFNGRAESFPFKNFDSDSRPNPYDIDSDGDGIIDVIEADFTNPSFLGWVVGPFGADGWSDVIDAQASLNNQNTDGRGNPNFLDIDSDDDGIPDQIEGQPTANPLPAGYTMPLGTDADGDGLDTRWDNRPLIFGGTGIVPINIDGDLLPDYIDLDTDADGQPDIVEGNDFNMNNIADDNVTLTLADTDGDGLDNRFDSSNATIKGTSYNLSIGGYTTGDPAPGARCPVSRKNPAHTDRAWRYAGAVLPVQILTFAGKQQGYNNILNWSIITKDEIERFEVERSVNNVVYSKISTVQKAVQLNTLQQFNYTDDVSSLTATTLYYRIKIITKAGEVYYSNNIVISIQPQTNTIITIAPNPATTDVSIKFTSNREEITEIRLVDNTGRIILKETKQVIKGINTVQLNNLSKLSNGLYLMQFMLNGEMQFSKIVITH